MSVDATRTGTDLSQAIAAEVRAWMGRRGVRQSELARRLGENDQWLSIRLRGAKALDANDIGRIAGILGVKVVDLLPQREREVTVTYLKESTSANAPPVLPTWTTPTRPANMRSPTRPSDRRPPSGPGRTSRVRPPLAA